MRTPDILLHRLQGAFEAARDPGRARAAAAYMRNQFPFLGIRARQQAAIYREVTAGLPAPAGDAELATLTFACWQLPEREYQHFGTTYLQRHVRRASPDFIPTLEHLVTTKSWWDTVDGLATRVAGPLVAANPELRTVMDSWVESENILQGWRSCTRSAIASGPIQKCSSPTACGAPPTVSSSFARRSAGRSAPTQRLSPTLWPSFSSFTVSGLSRREAERGVAMGRAAARPTR